MSAGKRTGVRSAAQNANDAHDVQKMLKDLLGDTLQGMLEAVFTFQSFTILPAWPAEDGKVLSE